MLLINDLSLTKNVCRLGKGVNCGEKTTLSQSKMTSPAQVKPFAGKVFYLDLPSNRTAEALESDIKELGGVRQKHIWLLINFRKALLSFVMCQRHLCDWSSYLATELLETHYVTWSSNNILCTSSGISFSVFHTHTCF